MDKLRMQSRDVVGDNVEKIAALFPHCVTERIGRNGKPELAIDFDKLRAELSDEILDEGEERYQFTWPDKRAAARLANEPINKTLRPCREESVGKDGTPRGFDSENLYIEGDNLDVLKVLRETYLGCVKMIYIDPPYNTGNDFVYNDDFVQGKEGFEQTNGAFDAEGNQMHDDHMQRNTEANGRFHTDWLNMIYPRLKVARDLLADDGVIFISIDDNEVDNLSNIANEVFGAENNVIRFCWRRRKTQANLSKFVSQVHEYILVYAKNIDSLTFNRIPYSQEYIAKAFSNKDNDPKGLYQTGPLARPANSSNKEYTLTMPNGRQITAKWSCSQETFDSYVKEGRLFIPRDGEGMPRIKIYLSELPGMIPNTWLDDVASNDDAARMISTLFGSMAYFDYSKPIELIQFLLNLGSNSDSLILDFFSGSATTAHAVMKLNAEDGGSRKFIMVQLPEVTDEKSEARKAGYANICEIGKERIRRAGKKIKEEAGLQGQDIDIGFRVLKLDSSNMEDVFYTPDKFEPSLLDSLVDNIKADRSGEDLLFQVMLDLGIELSSSIRNEELGGRNCWIVDDGYLIACFDKDVNETTIEEMAKLLPTHLVIRDASAATDNVLDNFDQIIESYSAEKAIKTHVL